MESRAVRVAPDHRGRYGHIAWPERWHQPRSPQEALQEWQWRAPGKFVSPVRRSAGSGWKMRSMAVPAWLAGVLVGVTFFLMAAAWAVTSPPGSSPDDDFHLSSIWCAWGDSPDLCQHVDGTFRPGEAAALVPADVARAACFAFKSNDSGACYYTLDKQLVPARINGGSYPGLFYVVMRAFVTDTATRSVLLMRGVNALLAALLLGAAVSLSAPLLRRAVALAWLGAMVPLGVYVIASTNPSSWAVAGVGTYWAFLLRWLRPTGQDGRRRRPEWAAGAMAVVAALVASGARADAAAYIVVSTVACLLLEWRAEGRRWWSWSYLLPVLVAFGAVAMFFRGGQSAALAGIGAGTGREPVSLFVTNVLAYPGLVAGVWAQGPWSLGWLDTPVPVTVPTMAMLAAGGLLALGLGAWWWRKGAALLVAVGALVAVPLWILQKGGNVVGENVQPRYLLPLVVLVLGLALLALRPTGRTSWRLGPAAGATLALLVAAAQSLAIHDQIRRYVTGIDGWGTDLSKGVEWWWKTGVPGPNRIWLLGTVFGLLFAATAVLVALGAQREAARPRSAEVSAVDAPGSSDASDERAEADATVGGADDTVAVGGGAPG